MFQVRNCQFDADTTARENPYGASVCKGIKVHKSADADTLAAIKRLYEKGLLTQEDGGYLTDLGIHCAEHLQTALRILNATAQTS